MDASTSYETYHTHHRYNTRGVAQVGSHWLVQIVGGDEKHNSSLPSISSRPFSPTTNTFLSEISHRWLP